MRRFVFLTVLLLGMTACESKPTLPAQAGRPGSEGEGTDLVLALPALATEPTV